MDKDGNDDLVLSSFCGTTHIFYGNKDGSLAKGELIKDINGIPVNAGKYELKVKKDRYTTDTKRPWCAKAVIAVDWDGDKDYDLVMSSYEGSVLYKNIGNRKGYKYDKREVIKLPKKTFIYKFEDFDSDGLKDVLVVNGNYEIGIHKNIGSKKAPVFGPFKCLVKTLDPTVHGSTIQLDYADINEDGKKDIIAGLFASWTVERKGLTETEKKHKAKVIAKQKEIGEKRNKFSEEMNKKYANDYKKISEEWRRNKEMQALGNEEFKLRKEVAKYIKGYSGGLVYKIIAK